MQSSLRGVSVFSFFDHQVTAASSEREYRRSNQDEFLKLLRIPPSNLRRPKQVHGDQILVLDSEQSFDPAAEADGVITVDPSIAIGVLTADCIPAFFWDPLQQVAGIAHAGWRGLHAGILPKMVHRMRCEFDSKPSTLQIGIGPCIRPCCYEVGAEFSEYFPKHFQKAPNSEKGRVDLAAIAKDQLTAAGIIPIQIHDSNICTSCQNDRFFSARREKTDERILSVIQIR